MRAILFQVLSTVAEDIGSINGSPLKRMWLSRAPKTRPFDGNFSPPDK
jgi:hypothetical protein